MSLIRKRRFEPSGGMCGDGLWGRAGGTRLKLPCRVRHDGLAASAGQKIEGLTD